jgi:hypothetical protein
MCTIPFVGWITNAAVRLTGHRGAVTERPSSAACSRQCVYDRARKVSAAVQVEPSKGGGPTREQLTRQNAALRQQIERRKRCQQRKRQAEKGRVDLGG